MKFLSSRANVVIKRCAEAMCTTAEDLRKQFEEETPEWTKFNREEFARNLLEFCCFKALNSSPWKSTKRLGDRDFSCFTFDMMIAWEYPSAEQEKECSEEDQRRGIEMEAKEAEDESSLFYSDLMPMLVDVESSVGEAAFIRLGPAMPLVADVVSAHFQFQTLTASTAGRLPFPLYHNYLNQLHKGMKLVKSQSNTSLDLAEKERVLHIDGTATTQRVVRHIGGTSWPGRLTLTNYALYFETSGVLTYEKALKFDLSTDTQHEVKAGSTGPWGTLLFDKAVIYSSPEIEEPLILEFPELTGSSRRDYWLAIIKEVISLHKFIRKFHLQGREEEETMGRAMAGVIRLHATRETFKIFPPCPENLLTFTLSEELLPKGDSVSQELANSVQSCTNMFWSAALLLSEENEEEREACGGGGEAQVQVGERTALEACVHESREEAKKTEIARISIEGLLAEGITGNGTILMELLSPLMNIVPWFQELLNWQRPFTTASVFLVTLLITYKEWIGYAVSALLFMGAALLLWIRRTNIKDKYNEIVVSTSSDQSSSSSISMETVVSAQQAISYLNSSLKATNIILLKLLSIALSKPRKHSNEVILGLVGLAITFLFIPLKFINMGIITHVFTKNLAVRQSSSRSSDRSARRLKDWWDSVPAIPVRLEK
ncbi:hypothetical protein SUGI_0121570 [Cryptomeria japonica]|nr:hypothetical protein SUGI_0121570 [Cryptomeria japonica]